MDDMTLNIDSCTIDGHYRNMKLHKNVARVAKTLDSEIHTFFPPALYIPSSALVNKGYILPSL